jgi:hypothetical protein
LGEAHRRSESVPRKEKSPGLWRDRGSDGGLYLIAVP